MMWPLFVFVVVVALAGAYAFKRGLSSGLVTTVGIVASVALFVGALWLTGAATHQDWFCYHDNSGPTIAVASACASLDQMANSALACLLLSIGIPVALVLVARRTSGAKRRRTARSPLVERVIFVILAAAAFLAVIYCVLAIAMVGSFASVPGYPQDRAADNLRFWFCAVALSLFGFASSATAAYKRFRYTR